MQTQRSRHLISLLAICAALAALTLAAYAPVLDCGFVNYDDDFHITKNPQVQAGLAVSSVKWAFTTFATSNWHPVTWLSHMLDCAAYGLNPLGHHLTSLLIHVANALLLFLLLARLTGAIWQSAAVSALFAIHPLQVESVAWVSERKDVLSTLFWLLTTSAYVSYVRRGGAGRCVLTAVLFALGLMAKPMLVSLPLVLLLLDYWPLGRYQVTGQSELQTGSPETRSPKTNMRRLASFTVEKLPLFALAAASCVVTWFAQGAGRGAAGMLGEVPLPVRLDNALVSYVAYICKTLWPANLAVIYPHPLNSIPLWQVIGSGALLALVSALAIRTRGSRPYLFVGWFWYVVTLIPVIGLVQVGEQGMADRYTYIPLIGIFIVICWGLSGVPARKRFPQCLRWGAYLAGAGIVIALASLTRTQISCWRDSKSLFTQALHATRGNYVAHLNLAIALDEDGDWESAGIHYENALGLRPDWPEALYNYAVFLAKNGDSGRAISYYRRAIRVRPTYVNARYNLAVLYDSLHRTPAAIREYEAVLRLAPNHAQAHNNLAVAFYSIGRYADAWKHVRAAQSLGFHPHPDFIRVLSSRMPEPE